MSFASKMKEHAWTTAVGAALAIVGAAAAAGAVAWSDGRYVLLSSYTSDQVGRGVLTVDMQLRQVDWKLRDIYQSLTDAEVRGDVRAMAQARADLSFYGAEKEMLIRKRNDVLRGL